MPTGSPRPSGHRQDANRWHIARGEHPIYYTDFRDLKSLLQQNWPDFEDLFPDLNWIASRIAELELSRNVIAHSNTLDERQLARIWLYMQDWIKQGAGRPRLESAPFWVH